MIYLEPTTCIGVENFIKSWTDFPLPKETMQPHVAGVTDLLTSIVPSLLQFVAQQCTEYQKTVWPNLLSSMLRIFDAFMEPFTPTRVFDPPPEKRLMYVDSLNPNADVRSYTEVKEMAPLQQVTEHDDEPRHVHGRDRARLPHRPRAAQARRAHAAARSAAGPCGLFDRIYEIEQVENTQGNQ